MNRPIRSNLAVSFRVRLVATAIGIGATLATAPNASAQFGGSSGMASMFTPDFLPRDLPVFFDTLQLEEWQRPVLEQLIDEYVVGFHTAAHTVRSRLADTKTLSGDSSERLLESIGTPLLSWMEERERLRDEFLSRLRGPLIDSQLEHWPRLERTLRREKSLPLGQLSGESLDLFVVLREVDAPPSAIEAASPIIDAYELRLHEALGARDAALDSSVAPLLRAMTSNDVALGVATQEAIMLRRIAVRTVQEESLAQIRDSIGGELGAAFERRALRRAFPQVFRPDPVTPLFESALALPELADDVRASIRSLQAQFDDEHVAVRQILMQAYRATEPGEPRRRSERTRRSSEGQIAGSSEAEELVAAKSARDEFYSRYESALAGLLTLEQLRSVPGLARIAVEKATGSSSRTFSQLRSPKMKLKGPMGDARSEPDSESPPEKSAPGSVSSRPFGSSADDPVKRVPRQSE